MRGGGRAQPDGEVDEEDRAPVDELGQHAAEEHADGGAGAADRAPDAERLGALAGRGRCVVMIDSAAGESIAAPRPWPARAANSIVGVAGERGGQRRGGEHAQAGEEHAAAAEQVGGAAAEQQQAAEDQRVAGDRPADVAAGDVQVLGHVRQRDVHGA